MREHFQVPMSSTSEIASMAYGHCMDTFRQFPSIPLLEYSTLLSQRMSGPLVRLASITLPYTLRPPSLLSDYASPSTADPHHYERSWRRWGAITQDWRSYHLSSANSTWDPPSPLQCYITIPLTLLSSGLQYMHSSAVEHTWCAYSTAIIEKWKW